MSASIASVDRVADFLADLGPRVSGDLRSDTYTRLLYSTDASIYQVMPHAVLLPRHDDDVRAAVSLAAEREVPILARCAGSSLVGQAVNEALVIDFTRHLDHVLELNTEERWVRVQPGIVLDELNSFLRPHGLQFGPDPASSNRAAMGGIVANNSTGSHSIQYGMTADHVLGVEALLSDGSEASFGPLDDDQLAQRVERPGLEGDTYRGVSRIATDAVDQILAGTPRHWRRCGGYNLDRFVEGASFKYPQDPRFNMAKLICGSEGTLAVMRELQLNLVPTPTHTGLAIVQFDSLRHALTSVTAILETGPTAVELMDNLGLTMCRGVPQYARLLPTFLEGEPHCILITEYQGDSLAELEEAVERLQRHLRSQGIPGRATAALDPQLQRNVWTVRKVGLGLMMSVKGDHKPVPFIEDAAVPVEHLADYVTRIEQFCNDLGTKVGYYAHASAGCIHIRPVMNNKLASEVAKLPQIAEFSVGLLGEYGGAWSSEHGDGRARSWLNERFFGRDLYQLYRQVKGLFDPRGLLNPGNIVDAPAMTEHLRFGADYRVADQREHIDFSSDQGYHRAVEMCNGAGICRKKTEGTMCPSFMATREEEHSTRGRANLLRAAMSGRLEPEELTGKRLFAAMDLCVECKACKAECPSSVDMAKIKFEYLTNYYEANPVPRRTRMFAAIARTGRRSSGWRAPLVNALLRNPLVRALAQGLFGISRQRRLPAFARVPFTRWFEKRRHSGAGGRAEVAGEPRNVVAQRVVLFNDTFNTYNTPEIAIAATEVLEAAGCEVVLPGHYCCGRPMVSKGLVEEARAAARHTVDVLAPLVEQGMPVVGVEPSCILTLKDEYLSLLPGDTRAQAVADAAITFEEFVAGGLADGSLALPIDTAQPQGDARVLLHGHCHQKALVGTEPTKAVLAAAGYAVEEVDSGCCGMAGSFGYEAEHLEVSLAMAERRLLPAVRRADGQTVVAAAGASCRAQIAHGSDRHALHPAQVLRARLTATQAEAAGDR